MVIGMAESRHKQADVVRSLVSAEGCGKAEFPYLTLYRYTENKIAMPDLENPYLYVVFDGAVRFHTPSGIMDYIAGQYSVSEIDTPTAGYVLTYSEKGDFLAAALEFTLNDVISVVIDLEENLTEKIINGRMEEDVMRRADHHVIESMGRLISAMKESMQMAFIGRQIQREIIFFVLCGSCGKQFLQSIVNVRQAGEIYEVNSWIKENFRDSFTVDRLAEERNMSVSQLHQKFKSAVGMGPLQCQKRLRLTEARRLMLDENKNATEASMEVGYESISQFTRDYHKMFGNAPKEDILKLRKKLKK